MHPGPYTLMRLRARGHIRRSLRNARTVRGAILILFFAGMLTIGLVGALLAVGGAYSNPGGGPFPEDGIIPFLKPLYDYSWAVGLVAGLLIYLALAAVSPARRPEPVASPAG